MYGDHWLEKINKINNHFNRRKCSLITKKLCLIPFEVILTQYFKALFTLLNAAGRLLQLL